MNQNNNFNTQGNNINNQNFNNNSYQQPINQMNMQQPTPQPINSFDNSNVNNQSFNSKPPKKANLGLIIGIVAVAVVIVIGVIFGSKLLSKDDNTSNNGTTNNSGTNTPSNVVYNDNSRDIKSTYTFDEATSKFAFKEYETTLIFQKNNNVKLSSIKLGNISNISFYYDNETSYFTFNFEESGSTNINEFIENFKNGILGGGKKQSSFENIKILETNDEYVFISCQESGNSSYRYYFAKQIGNKVFYAYSNRNLTELNDEKKSEMLNGFKELFNALSSDDNKEPYISDKILNVPIVLDKQIKSYEFIDTIQLVHPKTSTLNYRDYIKGSTTLYSTDTKRLEIYYDAEQFYNKLEWANNINSKVKVSEDKYGIKDNNITQIFNISKTENIDNENKFNEYLNKFFN